MEDAALDKPTARTNERSQMTQPARGQSRNHSKSATDNTVAQAPAKRPASREHECTHLDRRHADVGHQLVLAERHHRHLAFNGAEAQVRPASPHVKSNAIATEATLGAQPEKRHGCKGGSHAGPRRQHRGPRGTMRRTRSQKQRSNEQHTIRPSRIQSRSKGSDRQNWAIETERLTRSTPSCSASFTKPAHSADKADAQPMFRTRISRSGSNPKKRSELGIRQLRRKLISQDGIRPP